MSARPGRSHKKEEKKKVPELAGEEHRPSPNTSSHTGLMFPYAGLLEARDYMGAITLLEFERKMFMDQKQASGWKDTSSGYEWVEGGIAQLNEEERQVAKTKISQRNTALTLAKEKRNCPSWVLCMYRARMCVYQQLN